MSLSLPRLKQFQSLSTDNRQLTTVNLLFFFRYYLTGIFLAIFTFFALKGALSFLHLPPITYHGSTELAEVLSPTTSGSVLPFFGERKILETTETQEFPGPLPS